MKMKRFDTGQNDSQLKEAILDAADKRFRSVGFRKTTMSEIAQDIGMSTGNLYRYFPSKIDIAEDVALRCFAEKEKVLAEVIARSGLSPEQRIEEFAMALLHYNYQQLLEIPTINEIIEALCEARPQLVERKRTGEAALLTQVLEEGVNKAAWKCTNCEMTSRTILASWILFGAPMYMKGFELQQLEGLLKNMIDLLLNGLVEGGR